MKTTLVIHPRDSSTLFLEGIYATVPHKTVVTGKVTKTKLLELIESHDRVMMLGHGSPDGLLSCGKFIGTNGLIVDDSMVEALRTKDNSVFIWCYADEFVTRYGLNGFFTGMFVSEVGESYYCGVDSPQNIVDASNYAFSFIASKYINEISPDLMYRRIINDYGIIASYNPIARYNHKRLYLSGDGILKTTTNH